MIGRYVVVTGHGAMSILLHIALGKGLSAVGGISAHRGGVKVDNAVGILDIPRLADIVERYIVIDHVINLYAVVKELEDILIRIELSLIIALGLGTYARILRAGENSASRGGVIRRGHKRPHIGAVFEHVVYQGVNGVAERIHQHRVGEKAQRILYKPCLVLIHELLKEAVVEIILIEEGELLCVDIADYRAAVEGRHDIDDLVEILINILAVGVALAVILEQAVGDRAAEADGDYIYLVVACVPLDHLDEVIKLVDDRNIVAEGIVGEEIEVILIVVVEIAFEGNAAVDIVLLLFTALGEGVGVFLYLHIADAFAVAVAHIHTEAKIDSRGQSLAKSDIPLE